MHKLDVDNNDDEDDDDDNNNDTIALPKGNVPFRNVKM